MIIKSEQEMLDFGKSFAKTLKNRVIELIGDVGTGKTTFTRGLAQGLGIKETVTSPSFTISKSYALPNSTGRLIHYDFYRLPDPGLMVDDLCENLNDQNSIIVVEWGESIENILPQDRIRIDIQYTETGNRDLSLQY